MGIRVDKTKVVSINDAHEEGVDTSTQNNPAVARLQLDFVQNRPRSEISFVAIWSQAGSRENVIPPKSRHLATDCHIG